jgi:glucokinase
MAFLCIDIGGTNTLFGIGDNGFQKVKELKTREFLLNFDATIQEVMDEAGYDEVDQIAIAAAGPVDREKGLFYPPNIDKEFVQIKDPLQEYGEVNILNDCAAAVMGEYHYGESADELLYVTISSGIGAAYVSEGHLVDGWNGNFGEVGHMTVGEELECGCGGKGHWEAYCSGNNLPDMAEELYGLEADNARDIFEMESEKAQKVIEEFRYRNRVGIANLINLYNPEKIVFGGAVALNHFEDILEAVEGGIKDDTINELPEMTLCGLGEIAVLHGLKAACKGEIKR